jgi:hypothetical protein
MSTDSMRIHIDLEALQGGFFRRLPHQLDVIKILQIGCEQVTEGQVSERAEFGSFIPANGAQLSHEVARSEAKDWLLNGFLRDAIEGGGLFLDECLQICDAIMVAAKGTAKAADIHRVLHVLPKANHKLHFPQKLEKLERMFGVVTRFNAHVLSLNKARTCVVHRLGTVSPLDVDGTGVLRIRFHCARFIARGVDTGQELLLDRPGLVTAEDSVVEVHFVDSERRFREGERVRLQAGELYDTIITLWRFGAELVQAIEAYAKQMGIEFPAVPG